MSEPMSDRDHDLRGQWLAVKARANSDVLTDADVAWIIERFREHNEVPSNGVCMGLVKRFKLRVRWHYGQNVVRVVYEQVAPEIGSPYEADLNVAICKCVAALAQEREKIKD